MIAEIAVQIVLSPAEGGIALTTSLLRIRLAGLRAAVAGGRIAMAVCLLMTPAGSPALASTATEGRRTFEASPAAALMLPFHIERGFLLIDGTVDGQAGGFMLDTGTPFTFFLNREFVKLPDGEPVASGNAASGQAITVLLHRQPHAIRLAGGARFLPTKVRSGDFGFVAKGLGVPLLGFIGAGLLRDWRFELDFRRGLVALRPLGVGEVPAREVPLAVINFQLAGNTPSFTVDVGGTPVPAMLDTGAPDSVALTGPTRARLTASGAIVIPDEAHRLTIPALSVGAAHVDLPNVTDEGSSRDRIVLGHGFLSRYRSVWDYRAGTVTLYRR